MAESLERGAGHGLFTSEDLLLPMYVYYNLSINAKETQKIEANQA
jgi:hypothetical protein